nr:nucleotide-binding alpha-beta plait domain-containing protein [Tanacetum cinerariifolium]
MNEDDLCGDNMDMADVPETVFDEANGQKKDVSQDPFELSYSLMGRVKEFASLRNLKTALLNEGFVDFS